MKQAMMLGILTVLFMTLLTACGNSAESNHSQEVQDMTVEIANYMKEHAAWGDTIFYDIYTEEEKAADPEKEDTGLRKDGLMRQSHSGKGKYDCVPADARHGFCIVRMRKCQECTEQRCAGKRCKGRNPAYQ